MVYTLLAVHKQDGDIVAVQEDNPDILDVKKLAHQIGHFIDECWQLSLLETDLNTKDSKTIEI